MARQSFRYILGVIVAMIVMALIFSMHSYARSNNDCAGASKYDTPYAGWCGTR